MLPSPYRSAVVWATSNVSSAQLRMVLPRLLAIPTIASRRNDKSVRNNIDMRGAQRRGNPNPMSNRGFLRFAGNAHVDVQSTTVGLVIHFLPVLPSA